MLRCAVSRHTRLRGARSVFSVPFGWAGAGIAAAAGSVGLAFRGYRVLLERRKFGRLVALQARETYIANVLRSLEHECKTKPPTEPVFSRCEWTCTFQRMLGSAYVVCHGASGIGKSESIARVVAGKTGVIYLALRPVAPECVVSAFSVASAMPHHELGENMQASDVLDVFGKAAERFVKNHSRRVIVIIEDLHCHVESEKHDGFLCTYKLAPETSRLVAGLQELYRSNLLSVVYTVSNFTGALALQYVSGHQEVSKHLFPPLDDASLRNQLLRIREEDSPLFSEKEAAFIVKQVGGHMRSINAVIADRKDDITVIDAVQKVVDAAEESLMLSFRNIDRAYKDAAWLRSVALRLMKVLEKEGTIALRDHYKHFTADIATFLTAVDILVIENLFSRDGDSLFWQKRSTLTAFRNRRHELSSTAGAVPSGKSGNARSAPEAKRTFFLARRAARRKTLLFFF